MTEELLSRGAAAERDAAVERLRESEQRYRLVVDNALDYAIFTTDPDGKVEQWYAGAAAVLGWSAEEISGRSMDITFTPEDRAANEPQKEREIAARDGRAPNVRFHVRKDGSRVFIEGVATALRDSRGALIGFLKIGRDASERQAADQAQRLLLAELQHRVRNTLSVVRSIARRTGERSLTVEEMVAHFQGRLDAFSRVQAVVTRRPGARVDLTGLIEDELLAHAAREGEMLSIKGPDIMLRPRAAETISLAIHELATNAVKYGALSAEGGRVAVTWERIEGEKGELLRLVWEENGMNFPADQPLTPGFGFELLQRTLPYELRAETKLFLRPEGLRFEMRMPLSPAMLDDE